jgi:hypothetical protein
MEFNYRINHIDISPYIGTIHSSEYLMESEYDLGQGLLMFKM